MRVLLVDPTTEPVPPQWDEFVAAHRLIDVWRAPLLVTTAWSAPVPTYLAVVEDGGTPVALFHARHVGLPAVPSRYRPAGPGRVVGPVECRMHPLGSPPAFAFAPELNDAARTAAVAAFERALRDRLGWRLVGVVYRQVGDGDLAVFRRRGWLSRPAWPAMTLENRWDDPAGYLADLAPKVRSQLRRISSTVTNDWGLRVSLEPALPAQAAAGLLNVVRARHNHRWSRQPVPVHYLEALSRGPDTEFLLYRENDGRVLAFATLHDDGTDLHSTFWGSRERTDGGRADLYFDQYARSVEVMIERGRRGLTLGKGMTEIKARYGGRPQPRHLVAGRG